MSHLDHVLRVKEALKEKGIACPFQHRSLIDNAFVDALVAGFFSKTKSFIVSEDNNWEIRAQIDRWNNVNPIGHEWIYAQTRARINLAFTGLSIQGRYTTSPVPIGTSEACFLEDMQSYKDLVGYLFQEAKNCHE